MGKKGDYCSTFGEASCADDELLDMMEANDNHAEEHTVAEFIEFCVNGRSDKSGTRWSARGPTVLPSHCRRRASLQPDWGRTCWHYPQETCRGWHLSCWWHWLHLHLLWTRRGQV